jgi:hypothetical protein
MFFRDGKIYSYGMHFCIARHIAPGVIAFTTRGYSISTTNHKSEVRSAARHLRTVYCNDPGADARSNMNVARSAIRAELALSAKPHIHQATRAAHQANALRGAEHANEYLAALPAEERGTETPIDTSDLEAIRASLDAMDAACERLAREAHAARLRDLTESLGQWRAGEIIVRTGLYELPPALRLSADRTRIETSHGAGIPTRDARRLWALVTRCREAGRGWTPPPGVHAGVYTLREVRADGSIVVGCHDIAFAELVSIAHALGFEVPADERSSRDYRPS